MPRRRGFRSSAQRRAMFAKMNKLPQFGTVDWQVMMIKNINQKIGHGEKLSPQEKSFLKVMSETRRI